DVRDQLGPTVTVSRGPLVRESLRLQNIELPAPAARLAWLAENVPNLPGSGIIYALTIGDAQSIATWLQSQGIDAYAYWGGQESSIREELENRLLKNKLKALVATTALGMGFDKPDLGFVIHYQRPGSVVHYYQQVGRAGRALPEAYGILLSGREDNEITDYFIKTAFPPEAHVEAVLDALGKAEDGLSVPLLERDVNLMRGQIEKVLKSLAVKSPAPVTKIESKWYATPVHYEPDREKIAQLTGTRYREQAVMTEYIQSRQCLMQFLALELDDENPVPCGKCAVCMGGPLLSESYSPELARRAMQYLRRGHYSIEPRKQSPRDALPSFGWAGSIPPELRYNEGRALSHWADDGWGTLVRNGKQIEGSFNDELVEASAALITERWKPDPAPTWVTSIPSQRHEGLVDDFARRLALQLHIPFVNSISKQCSTTPQKEMENSYQQAHNLDGAFLVNKASVQNGPVLLVDDIVDSRWTFTVAAAQLLMAGSGPVYPFALADSSKSDNG
ncbi:MAG: ATP-dependent DNA helicase RecG, partial [Chloroflexota bacterium]|nr:ATP-dependent DNA helicase RecG [Chloroflexota bacterium]